MILYFNPACSKCNEARTLLENNDCDVEIRDYLRQPPDMEELRELVKMLGCKPSDLIRTVEPLFQERFAHLEMSGDDQLRMLSEFPILIQRPILINGNQAIIGRPPALVLSLV
jgi:arsenate reductase (glutaredoxin)